MTDNSYLHEIPGDFNINHELYALLPSNREATQLEHYEPKESVREVRDLFMAARRGVYSVMDHPLAGKARDVLGNTPLHVFALSVSTGFMQYEEQKKFIGHPDAGSVYNDAGFTPAHLIAMRAKGAGGFFGGIGWDALSKFTAEDRFGWTPLHWLAYNLVDDIVTRNAERATHTRKTRNGVTPLHVFAARGGVFALKHHKASRVFDTWGRSPLLILAMRGEKAVLEHPDAAEIVHDPKESSTPNLTSKRIVGSPNFITGRMRWMNKDKLFDQCSALHMLAEGDCLELLKHPEAGRARRPSDGCTPLHILAERGNVEVLEHSLVAVVMDDRGRTPLHELCYAARRDSADRGKRGKALEIVKKALQHPKVASVADERQTTPLHILARAGFKEALEHPEVAVPKNNKGLTPLHCACYRRELWEAVLRHEAVASVHDERGLSPLYYLAHDGFLEVLNHPRVASDNNNAIGTTPLHVMAKRGFVEATRHPEASTVRNNAGETPADLFNKRQDAAMGDPKSFTEKEDVGAEPFGSEKVKTS